MNTTSRVAATPIDWIRFNCHLTSNAAADLIAVGKNLHRMPESVQAISAGEIGYAHMKPMARTANAVGAKFDEAPLLEKARENSAGKFHYICDHYRHAADRKGFEAEQAELVENRRLWISTSEDGTVQLTGYFDPEGGATLRTALSRWRASQAPMTTAVGRSGWRMQRSRSPCMPWTAG